MVRTTTRDDESQAEASVSTPDYRLTGVDLVDVSEGDRVTFTTTTKRRNGVRLHTERTLTVDDVTVTEEESTENVRVPTEWLPDGRGVGECPDHFESATVSRDVVETHVEVVAIDDGTRYTFTQVDTGFVRVSSCDQSDFVDQNERGEWNAVARSNVSHGVLKSWSHDEVVTDGGVDLPEVGDTFVDTVRDRVREVTEVGTRKPFTADEARTVVVYDNDTSDYAADFRDARDDGHLVPAADTASETTRRVLEAKDADVTDPFAAAINEPMNDDDRHLVRFVGTRDGGVDFAFATGLCEWFEPDRIVAEHYDVVAQVEAALRHLADAADGRTVSTGRNGTFEVDPDTGNVVAVKLYDHAFDITGDDTHDDAADAMLRCFDGVTDTDTDDESHGCRVVVDTDDDTDDDVQQDDPQVVTDGGGYVTVTTYTINGRDTTTDTDEAEAAARRGCHVTAETERRRIVTDGGRRPLSAYDHAPDVGPCDVDKCRECGRYAPHAFDHAPDCSRFRPPEPDVFVNPTTCRICGEEYEREHGDTVVDEDGDVLFACPSCPTDPYTGDKDTNRTAASNPRMVRHATDGGDTKFDKPAQSPESIASGIVASTQGDEVAVWFTTDGTLSIYEGEVVATEYDPIEAPDIGGTHRVTIDVVDESVTVEFTRKATFPDDGSDPIYTTPDPVVITEDGARLPVTRFEGGGV